jgi:hypothetical protein
MRYRRSMHKGVDPTHKANTLLFIAPGSRRRQNSGNYKEPAVNRFLSKLFSLLALLVTIPAFAQNPPVPELQKGFTGFEEFQGTVNSDS